MGILVKHGRQHAYVLPQLSQNADKMTAWEQERYKYTRTQESAEDTDVKTISKTASGWGTGKGLSDQSLLN